MRHPTSAPLPREGRVAFPRWPDRVLAHVTAHVELYLSALVVGLALLLPLALELGTDTQELAGAALLACVLQGLLLWLLHRRARAIRQRLIGEVRGLLRDRINNHLQVVLFSLAEQGAGPLSADDRERLTLALEAVTAVSRTLDELSTESLRRWRARYGAALTGAASFAGSAADSGTGGWAAGRSPETCRMR
jgi:hypothetical protein